MQEDVREVLKILSPLEQEIITSNYGFYDREEINLKELGRKLNISGERVRQIRNKALTRIKKTHPHLLAYIRK